MNLYWKRVSLYQAKSWCFSMNMESCKTTADDAHEPVIPLGRFCSGRHMLVDESCMYIRGWVGMQSWLFKRKTL
jgi:hypothetical protein